MHTDGLNRDGLLLWRRTKYAILMDQGPD